MIFGKSNLEFKVGLFVFIGLIILTIFVLMIGDFKHVFSNYKVNFTFNFINGAKVGAPIRFAGFDIGEIREIILIPSANGEGGKVKLVGWIKKEVKIPSDSTVWINTLGLLGEKYVEIMPGKDYTNCLKFDGELLGNDPYAMQEFGELARNLGTKLDDVLTGVKGLSSNLDDGLSRIKNKEGSLGKLLYEDKIYNELDALVTDVRKNPWKLFWKSREKK